MKNKYLVLITVLLLVFYPIMRHGYIFALDHHWPVYPLFPKDLTEGWAWFKLTRYFLLFIIPSYILEKIWVLLVASLCFLSGYSFFPKGKDFYTRSFTGILYLVNPYTYSHFISGQFGVLFSYALLPVFINILFSGISFSFRKLMKLSLLVFLVCATTLHYSFIISLIVFIYLVIPLTKNRLSKEILDKLKIILLVLLISVGLNSNWLLPTYLGLNDNGKKISKEFNRKDFMAFRTVSDNNIWLNVLTMRGFWVERQKDFKKIDTEIFIYVFIALLLLVSIGIYKTGNKSLTVMFVLLSVVGYILALGISTNFSSGITMFLYRNFSFYRGMREPHKWVVLLIVSYTFFASNGINFLLDRLKRLRLPVSLLSMGIPFLLVPNMVCGFQGELHISEYPKDWYEIREYIADDTNNVLFLPWHEYMRTSFTKKIVANPGPMFFRNIISGDNIEFLPYIYTQSVDPVSSYIETLIGIDRSYYNETGRIRYLDTKNIKNFGRYISSLNIKYIILAKEIDYRRYGFLDTQTDIKLLKETEKIILYLNLKWDKKYKDKY